MADDLEGAIFGDLSLLLRQRLHGCVQLFVGQRVFPKGELQVGSDLGEDFYG